MRMMQDEEEYSSDPLQLRKWTEHPGQMCIKLLISRNEINNWVSLEQTLK
jgi:hypothetical protein